MGACQCITNTSDNIDIKMSLSNTRLHKLRLEIDSDEKGKSGSDIALTKHDDEDLRSPKHLYTHILKSERKSKKSNSSYIFDYKEHAMVIFDVFNTFRNKPQKFFRKMLKNGFWSEIPSIHYNSVSSLKWSDEIYNVLYIRDGIEDISIVEKLLGDTLDCRCECVVLRIDGDYDPEMSILTLLQEYKNSLDILLNDKYTLGTVNCYNDPDRIYFYLIKKYFL